jgi:hypothetical protein
MSRAPRQVAVLDFETDPFDAENNATVFPFLFGLYYLDAAGNPCFNSAWDENPISLIQKTLDAINALPDAFIIYAHNGGRFDYMYLIKYVRGKATFKGRGLMKANIGPHELRDSFHIIPTALSKVRKDVMQYEKMHRDRRALYRDEILAYHKNDCIFLYEAVINFRERFGDASSIGSAAMSTLKKSSTFGKLSPAADELIRPFFFGGRVQCLKGHGIWSLENSAFKSPLKIYDVNSMYPSVMAYYDHPVSNEFIIRTDGQIRDNTRFVELECDSDGAFLRRETNGSVNPGFGRGHYFVSIWELDVARRYRKVRDENILRTIDFKDCANFGSFVHPLYDERGSLKLEIDTIPKEARATDDYFALERRALFLKLILNNAYGKFAQNPRRFREVFITDADVRYPPGENPPTEQDLADWRDYMHLLNNPSDAPLSSRDQELLRRKPEQWFWLCENRDEYYGLTSERSPFWIWKRPAQRMPHLYNNVATGASITGAARARLFEALCLSQSPYYCDTDSVICEDLPDLEIDASHLGAWKHERSIVELVIGGKKLYGYQQVNGEQKVKSKGVSGLALSQLRDMVAHNRTLNVYASKAPLLGLDGSQRYIQRHIRMTA